MDKAQNMEELDIFHNKNVQFVKKNKLDEQFNYIFDNG